jgi:hypothetical protein
MQRTHFSALQNTILRLISNYTSDCDTNVPLIGNSIDVFHLMGKTGLGFGEIGIHILWYKRVIESQ